MKAGGTMLGHIGITLFQRARGISGFSSILIPPKLPGPCYYFVAQCLVRMQLIFDVRNGRYIIAIVLGGNTLMIGKIWEVWGVWFENWIKVQEPESK